MGRMRQPRAAMGLKPGFSEEARLLDFDSIRNHEGANVSKHSLIGSGRRQI